MERLKQAGYPGVVQTFEWSFYSQGRHDHATDSEKFLNEAALQYYPRLQRVHTHVRERSFALFGRVGGG